MAVIITNIKTAISSAKEDIISAALKRAGLSKKDIVKAEVHKTSLDARHNNRITLVSSVWAELGDPNAENKLCSLPFCKAAAQERFMPKIPKDPPKNEKKIVIAGFGPAGMFAALVLAEYGFEPIVLERGGSVDERVEKVNRFWSSGILDISTNVQFGEGGAGTFSDGKLTTRINDPLCRYVLERFADFGAPDEILVRAKPHIGTDKLRGVVKAIRQRIEQLGGEVRFHTALTDFTVTNGRVTSVTAENGDAIPCGALILAVGHSARDTFEMLEKKKIFIEPKPFSVGVRIEHRQEDVNRSLYGKLWDNPNLPKGEYLLSYRQGERAAYTFCMCPGGVVVPSSSEAGGVVTNGMSEFARDGENANSAVAVSVSTADFGDSPLDGVAFAREIERKAYSLAGKNYSAPAATVGSFLNGGGDLHGMSVRPTYALGLAECNFDELFPSQVTEMLRTGLRCFAKKMRCFGDMGAVLTAPETRTSSPVRITRNEEMQSLTAKGLYPCGEGAGYAGGIMSAAVDGVKCAVKIMGGGISHQ